MFAKNKLLHQATKVLQFKKSQNNPLLVNKMLLKKILGNQIYKYHWALLKISLRNKLFYHQDFVVSVRKGQLIGNEDATFVG